MVYANFRIYSNSENRNPDIFISEEAKKFTEKVRADLDQMGAIVQNGTIQKDGFLKAYGETVYRCWNALHDHIMRERMRRRFENYMENFEWISNEAVKYWQKKGVNLTSISSY